jgi:hypothetical protein
MDGHTDIAAHLYLLDWAGRDVVGGSLKNENAKSMWIIEGICGVVSQRTLFNVTNPRLRLCQVHVWNP